MATNLGALVPQAEQIARQMIETNGTASPRATARANRSISAPIAAGIAMQE
jgi:hypothetical protein